MHITVFWITTRYAEHPPIPMWEMDSSSLCDDALAMAWGSSRGKGSTSLVRRQIQGTSFHTRRRRGTRLSESKFFFFCFFFKEESLPAHTVERNQSGKVWEADGRHLQAESCEEGIFQYSANVCKRPTLYLLCTYGCAQEQRIMVHVGLLLVITAALTGAIFPDSKLLHE